MGEYYWTVYGSHGEIEIDRDGSVILCKPQFDELGVESEYNEIGRIDLQNEASANDGFILDPQCLSERLEIFQISVVVLVLDRCGDDPG